MSKARKFVTPYDEQERTPLEIVTGGATAPQPTPAPPPATPAARVNAATIARVNALVPAEEKPRRTRSRRVEPMPLDVSRPVFNRIEAAQYLGMGRSTLLKIAQVGRDGEGKVLGHTRVGARLAFLREDLDRYLRNEEPRAGATIGWKINPNRQVGRQKAKK